MSTITTTYVDQIQVLRNAVYDGTNGLEIVSNFGGSVVLDTGTALTYSSQGEEYTCPVGQRIFWSAPDASNGFGPDLVPFPWVIYSPAVSGAPAATYALVTVTGTGSVPASLLGAVQTVDVTLAPVAGGQGRTLSGTVYTPLVTMRGAPNVLSGHGISNAVPPLPLSATSTRVTVISGIASLAGGVVHVVAQQLRTV